MTSDQITTVAHIMIIAIGGSALWRSSQIKGLVEIQEKRIAQLKEAFEECKQRLDEIESNSARQTTLNKGK